MKERKNITYPDWLRASHQFDNIELFQKSATVLHKLINKIRPTASDELEVLLSTYKLQLPDKSTLENFLLKELNEKGVE